MYCSGSAGLALLGARSLRVQRLSARRVDAEKGSKAAGKTVAKCYLLSKICIVCNRPLTSCGETSYECVLLEWYVGAMSGPLMQQSVEHDDMVLALVHGGLVLQLSLQSSPSRLVDASPFKHVRQNCLS